MIDEDNCDVESDLSVPMALQHKDADTQWDVPALTDHSYVSREPVNKPICHKQTQCGGAESLTHTILKNDTSSVLYTGLPLSIFFNHVAFLHKFYMANFKMHITDQILITLMKLNLLHSDLAEHFPVSQGVVSRILSYWIDTMEELMRIYIPWQPRLDNPEDAASVLQREVIQHHLHHPLLRYHSSESTQSRFQMGVIQPLLFQQYSQVFGCHCSMWTHYVNFSCI